MSFVLLMLLIVGAVVSSTGREQKPQIDGNMAVILLGTGTPFVDTERFGAAVLVEAGARSCYLTVAVGQ